MWLNMNHSLFSLPSTENLILKLSSIKYMQICIEAFFKCIYNIRKQEAIVGKLTEYQIYSYSNCCRISLLVNFFILMQLIWYSVNFAMKASRSLMLWIPASNCNFFLVLPNCFRHTCLLIVVVVSISTCLSVLQLDAHIKMVLSRQRSPSTLVVLLDWQKKTERPNSVCMCVCL